MNVDFLSPSSRRSFALALLLSLIAQIGAYAGAAVAMPSIVMVAVPAGFSRVGPPVLSADGSTVVGRSMRFDADTSSFEYRDYLWTRADGTRDFDELGSNAPDQAHFTPRAVSGGGSRIVGNLDDTPVLWERGVGITSLPFLVDGTSIAGATGISDDGRFVVGSAHDGGTWTQVAQAPGGGGIVVVERPRQVPVLWNVEAGSVVALSSERGAALDVSNDGVAVGKLQIEIPGLIDQSAAFRWEESRGQQLVPSGWAGSFFGWAEDVTRISADGSTLVGRNLDEAPIGYPAPILERPYFWSGAPGNGDFLATKDLTMLDAPIPAFGAARAQATGVSADGSTIVGTFGGGGVSNPFLWTRSGGFQDLEVLLGTLGISLSSWDLFDATDISADGKTIMGTGRFRDDQGRSSIGAWIAVIPEPSTALLLGAGLSILAGGRSRHAVKGSRRCRRYSSEPISAFAKRLPS